MLYVELAHLFIFREKVMPQVTEYPSIKRDLTFKLPIGIHADELIEKTGPQPDLQKISIVDAFQKKDEEFRRITYRFLFQSDTRTLLHDEVDCSIQTILSHLEKEHNLILADSI